MIVITICAAIGLWLYLTRAKPEQLTDTEKAERLELYVRHLNRQIWDPRRRMSADELVTWREGVVSRMQIGVPFFAISLLESESDYFVRTFKIKDEVKDALLQRGIEPLLVYDLIAEAHDILEVKGKFHPDNETLRYTKDNLLNIAQQQLQLRMI